MDQRCLFVFVGPHYLAWALTNRTGAPCEAWQRLDLGEGNSAAMNRPAARRHALAVALSRVRANARAVRMRVVVADNWLASALLPWSSAMHQQDTALAHARDCLVEAGHAPGPDDTIRQDDAPWQSPRLCFSFPQALLEALQACARRLHLPLESVLPLSAVGWALARRGHHDALLVTDQNLLLAVAGEGGHMRDTSLREGPFSEALSHQAQVFWQRQVLRNPLLGRASQVAVLALVDDEHDEPPALALLAGARKMCGSCLDAIAPKPAPLVVRVLPALAAMLALGLWLGAWQANGQAQALATQLQARQASAAAPVTAAPPQREQLARLAAVGAIIDRLNLPVVAALRALAPPPDIRVALQTLEWDGPVGATGGVFRLQAQAEADVDMLRYVAYLAGQEAFAETVLGGHEQPPDRAPLRFTVQAPWRGQS